MPMPMFTFLEKYNLKGKTIHPFMTHESTKYLALFAMCLFFFFKRN